MMPADEPVQDGLKLIADLDRTVHSPARLMILAILSVVDSADFTFLMTQSGLTKGNLSSHLNVLEENGYIRVEKEFVEKIPRTLVRLTKAGRAAVIAYARDMSLVVEHFNQL